MYIYQIHLIILELRDYCYDLIEKKDANIGQSTISN